MAKGDEGDIAAGAGAFGWGREGLGEVQDASGIVELHDAVFEGTVGQGAIDVGKSSVVERRGEIDGEKLQLLELDVANGDVGSGGFLILRHGFAIIAKNRLDSQPESLGCF